MMCLPGLDAPLPMLLLVTRRPLFLGFSLCSVLAVSDILPSASRKQPEE